MKFALIFLIFICSESLSSEFMLEISLPEGGNSDITIISQKLSAEKLSDLANRYTKIGLISMCSANEDNTICNIESSYENGSIRQGYPFFLYTRGSEVGLINLSDIKKIYSGLGTAAVFLDNKYKLLNTRQKSLKKIYFDDIDSNSEYLLFTTKASTNQIYFSREVPGWMSNIVASMATKMEEMYQQLAPAPETDVFTYIHYSGQPKNNSFWGDVDSGGNMSLRFYGNAWENYDKSAEISIIRFMAHEYFHRYYRYGSDNEWIMEGAAEAFSTALLYKGRYLNDSDFKGILKDKAIKCRESMQRNEDGANKYVNQDFSYSCGFFAFFNYPDLSTENVKALGASIDPTSPLEVLEIIESGPTRFIHSSHWNGQTDGVKIKALKGVFEESKDVSMLDKFFELIELDLLVL